MTVTADGLSRYNGLGFNFRAVPVWPLGEGGRIVERVVHGSLLGNNGETVRRMALAGVGLARMGDYHVRADLAAGRLVEVLGEVIGRDEEEIHAVFLGGPRMLERVRVFLDFVVPRLQQVLNG
ncbi:transcriptional activator TtdR [compost metagenome]